MGVADYREFLKGKGIGVESAPADDVDACDGAGDDDSGADIAEGVSVVEYPVHSVSTVTNNIDPSAPTSTHPQTINTHRHPSTIRDTHRQATGDAVQNEAT